MAEPLPSTGFQGILRHWRDDLGAATSVSLVALPLGLGISLACDAPPLSGVISAIIGGLFTTFVRGSHVAINGPTAGLIVVILTGMDALGEGGMSGFPHVLAAFVMAGTIQVILGLLKMGKLGDLFPASVISGMLATIGIIIFVKQFHVALGLNPATHSAMDALLEIPNSILHLNPVITGISLLCLFVLMYHSYLRNKILKTIPAPLQVLMVSIPIVFLLNEVLNLEGVTFLGYPANVQDYHLVVIPENLKENFILPDFSKMHMPEFWVLVISVTMVASLETLISTKAIDKLDHYKRRTDLNRDLFAVGLSTMVCAFIGGLPIVTVIVRSSVNINHNAKTRWSNFYHGVILFVFVVLFPQVIRAIPLACLATILVYTGYKLASPRVFNGIWMRGWEQLFIFLVTILASLITNLLWGIVIGIIATLIIQWIRSELNLKTFWRHLTHPEINVYEESKNVMHVEVKGIANFALMLKLINSLTDLGNGKSYIVDFSRTKLVDTTVLDFIHEHRERYFTKSNFEFVGLDVHKTSSPHPLALHILKKPMQKRLTGRQNELYHFAVERKYSYAQEISWDVQKFEKFMFFDLHLMEYQRNKLYGAIGEDINWMISDVTYNDGIMMASEEHNITVMTLNLPERLFDFTITKDDIRHLKSHFRTEDKIENLPASIRDWVELIDDSASYYIECLGKEVLIYRKMRLLSPKEIVDMHDYVEMFWDLMPQDLEKYKQIEKYFI